MRRPTTSPTSPLVLALVAVLLVPATAGAQRYDDPLLSGYGGPGAGEQSLFGGELLPARGGGGGPAGTAAPRTATGELDLSTAAARPSSDTGGNADVPSGEAAGATPGRGDGGSGPGPGAAGAQGAGGAGPGSSPVAPLAPSPTAALDRTASAGLPVSPAALLGFGALLLLLAGLAHVLRGTDPAGRTQPPTA